MDNKITTQEAAMIAGVMRGTILRWIKCGYLGDCKKQTVTRGNGCGYKIEISDLNKYLYRRHFGYGRNVTDIAILECDMGLARKAKKNLIDAIRIAKKDLAKIEKML